MKVIHEQVCNPHGSRIFNEERKLFPGLEIEEPNDLIAVGLDRDDRQWALADRIVAPSAFVRDEMLKRGADPFRVRVVPYGISEDWLGAQPRPRHGRVLFVGRVNLGKGVHYLAAAGRRLAERRIPCEVRVVGPVGDAIRHHPAFQGVSFIGRVSRSLIRDEFLSADIFVLPTLSEGMAVASLEALASGLPIITTPNCGAPITDGVHGFVVSIRDCEALANRMQQLIEDHQLRAKMSLQARLLAAEHTWERFGRRLIEATDLQQPEWKGRRLET